MKTAYKYKLGDKVHFRDNYKEIKSGIVVSIWIGPYSTPNYQIHHTSNSLAQVSEHFIIGYADWVKYDIIDDRFIGLLNSSIYNISIHYPIIMAATAQTDKFDLDILNCINTKFGNDERRFPFLDIIQFIKEKHTGVKENDRI